MFGFYYDMQKCIGCRTCQIACKERFGYQQTGINPRKVYNFEVGTYPDAKVYHTSFSCNHCKKAPCIGACPTGAMFRVEDGTVLHDDSLCVGCGACKNVCPYDAPQFLQNETLVGKCDGCYALRQAGRQPVCVESCPLRAIEYGDIDELKKKHQNNHLKNVYASGCASLRTVYGMDERKHEPEISYGMIRDADKCIQCRRCVTVCEKYGTGILKPQGYGENCVIGTENLAALTQTNCNQCKKCLKVCPVGAITEKGYKEKVHQTINAARVAGMQKEELRILAKAMVGGDKDAL